MGGLAVLMLGRGLAVGNYPLEHGWVWVFRFFTPHFPFAQHFSLSAFSFLHVTWFGPMKSCYLTLPGDMEAIFPDMAKTCRYPLDPDFFWDAIGVYLGLQWPNLQAFQHGFFPYSFPPLRPPKILYVPNGMLPNFLLLRLAWEQVWPFWGSHDSHLQSLGCIGQPGLRM